jgi:hypothetical protein
LIEQPSALPTTFTSSSGSGSAHATRFLSPSAPLKRVAASLPISARRAASAAKSRPLPTTPWRPSCFAPSMASATGFITVPRNPLRRCAPSRLASSACVARLAAALSAVSDSITCTSAMPSA